MDTEYYEDETLMKDKVVQMFRENTGLMGRDIADELGVTRQYVAKVLKQAGEDSMQRQKDVTEMRYVEWEKDYREMYSEDLTMEEMAYLLDVTPSIVAKLSKRTNLRFRTLADVRKRQRVQEIEELRAQGLLLREVADKLGISIGYVTRMVRWGKENGVRDAETKEESEGESTTTVEHGVDETEVTADESDADDSDPGDSKSTENNQTNN